MPTQTLALWLLLAGCVLSPGRCQHWSYGLSPGGRRALDSLSHTLSTMGEDFPHVDAPCGAPRWDEESAFAKMCRMKGFLGSVIDRENGHRTYKK